MKIRIDLQRVEEENRSSIMQTKSQIKAVRDSEKKRKIELKI